eukprot:TRINITY_DN4242_c0_g1_i2.p1 TRINITY_DN4242_c0_g1~~TRINITY_DN4242_c0_g1_i2.p1  ORF type:complete len:929 (+),score=188.10 TRINITY_DN4242_c0_g1_i2:147-2933(+)
MLELDVHQNYLTGSIPANIGNMTNLENLYLHSNSLTGTVPQSIVGAEFMQALFLYDNELSGTLPSALGSLTNLTNLDVHSNSFTGPLPSDFTSLINLFTLDLSENNLNGTIPASLNTLLNLTSLNLGQNLLHGHIPDLSALVELQALNLNSNNLTGPVPSNLTSGLVNLILNNNSLEGDVTQAFAKYTLLQEIILSGNPVHGSFPNFTSIEHLSVVYLENDNLTGPIPPAFAAAASGLSLKLGGNPLCSNVTITNNNSSGPISNACGLFTSANNSAFCPALPCAPGYTAPSPYLFLHFNGTCNCSEYAEVTLLLTSPPATAFDAVLTMQLETAVAHGLEIDIAQVLETGTNATSAGLVIEIQLFPAGGTWQAAVIGKILQHLQNDTILGTTFGQSTLLDSVLPLSLRGLSPPPPLSSSPSTSNSTTTPTSPSSSSGLQTWVIIVIAVGVACALLVAAVVAYFWFSRERKKAKTSISIQEEEKRKALLSSSTLERTPNTSSGLGNASSLHGGTASEFELKVQEHFVRPLPLRDVLEATDNFSEALLIGAGASGRVFRGKGPDGQDWAVKRVQSSTGIGAFQTEVDVISKMRHSNLVRLLAFCSDRGEFILIYEYVSHGTLRKNLDSRNEGGQAMLSWENRLDIAVGVAQGLHYLHSFAKPTIIHRDVKSENILLDHRLVPKVADFGMMKHAMMAGDYGGQQQSMAVAGTPGYMDPEYQHTFRATDKSDVYSFGVVLLELITGKQPVLDLQSLEDPDYSVTLIEWAEPHLESGNVSALADPALEGNFMREPMKAMMALAVNCLKPSGQDRPDMATVAWNLAELKNKSSGIPSEAASFESLMRAPSQVSVPGSVSSSRRGTPVVGSIPTSMEVERRSASTSGVTHRHAAVSQQRERGELQEAAHPGKASVLDEKVFEAANYDRDFAPRSYE